MRRAGREVTDFNEIIDIMRQCDVCRLALNDDPVPYILPLNFAVEVEGTQVFLYFHGAREGRKYELIARNPAVSFEMDCKHSLLYSPAEKYCTEQYASVIGSGVIDFVPDEEKFQALQAINNHYHPDGFPVNERSIPATTVMKLTVHTMTAKSNVGKIHHPGMQEARFGE